LARVEMSGPGALVEPPPVPRGHVVDGEPAADADPVRPQPQPARPQTQTDQPRRLVGTLTPVVAGQLEAEPLQLHGGIAAPPQRGLQLPVVQTEPALRLCGVWRRVIKAALCGR